MVNAPSLARVIAPADEAAIWPRVVLGSFLDRVSKMSRPEAREAVLKQVARVLVAMVLNMLINMIVSDSWPVIVARLSGIVYVNMLILLD